MRRSYVRSGSASLAVSSWGDDGTPIVAIHPGVADSRVWQWCAPVWAAEGHRVVAFDRRGFGATEYEAETHDELADLAAVIEATEARPAVLVGNSRGGGLAIDYALQNPDDVLAMILLAPTPTGYDGDWPTMPAEAELDERVDEAQSADDLDLVNRLEIRYWLDGVDQPLGRVGGEPRRLMTEMNALALRAPPIGKTVEHPPAWPRISQLRHPTLVVCGEYDLNGCRQLCDHITQALPSAHMITIAGSAHCPQLDQPEALDAAVLDFIASIGA